VLIQDIKDSPSNIPDSFRTSNMGRWDQDEDIHRLPEGIVRVAYDADTRQYTFRDTTTGRLYRSAPGEPYGTLHPVLDHLPSRPNAFAPEGSHRPRSRSAAQNTTFHDILPAHAIATSPTGTSTSPSIGSRLFSSADRHLRSQSTRIPPSSQPANNLSHSRSKSMLNRPRNPEHEHRSTHSHHHDRRHQSHHQSHHHRAQTEIISSRQSHSPPQSSSKGSKTGFSLSSALRSLSRSLTRRSATTPAQRRPENDKNHGYRRL